METGTLDYRFLTWDENDDTHTVASTAIPYSIDHDTAAVTVDTTLPAPYTGPLVPGDDAPLDAPYLESCDTRPDAMARLPELAYIDDDVVRDAATELATDAIRDDYWVMPASPTGRHHPVDERGRHGQWIHTKRMLGNTYTLARNAALMDTNGMDGRDVDLAMLAGVAHDMHKFGRDRPLDGTYRDHASTAASWLDRNGYPDNVVRAVHRHTGPQDYDGAPAPETLLDHFIHHADATAAQDASEQLLLDPHPALRTAQAAARIGLLLDEPDRYTITAEPGR